METLLNRYFTALAITIFFYFLIGSLYFFINSDKKEIDNQEKVTLKLSDFKIQKPKKIKTPKKRAIKKKRLYSLKKTIKKDYNTTTPKKILSLSELSNFFEYKEEDKYKILKQLYGNHYQDLDEIQKKFLLRNINPIGIITQQYLQYPYIAGKTGIQGT
ncbi:MAG: hypothetical protein OIF32_10575, partial [Campylobacterales bacterium]|nr:hypothetical protein [Campylobacterales bacterium]